MKANQKTVLALCFGNRGFFPASLQAAARRELTQALKRLGHETLTLDAAATRHGAVETPEEGRVYAEFLRRHRGRFGGVILCLPNFGDETGAIAALRDCGVPILIQAYPDELDRMAPDVRRDAFCGKMSVMDVFVQYGLPFTALTPHTVHPASARFAENVDYFDRLCRTVNGMKRMTVGAIGARTTPFKTVRFDELALERHGITTETVDLSDVFARVRGLKDGDERVAEKRRDLEAAAAWKGVPDAALATLARLAAVLDDLLEQMGLDALAIRCWTEMQQHLGVSPCVVLGLLNERGIAAACEVDVGNAVMMRALSLASGRPPGCLDWNNNYGDDPDKCILFHCGPLPPSLMAGKGRIRDHLILANAAGPGSGYGCNTGRIKPSPFTYGSLLTENGRVRVYLGEGRFTRDPIPADFFGCAGVAEIDGLQEKLQAIGSMGYRHHVSVAAGHVAAPVREAMVKYLGYEVTRP